MPSRKLTICRWCHREFLNHNPRKNVYCSKRCGGLAKRRPMLDRLMDLVIRPPDPTACWGWKGALHRQGYGSIKITDRLRTKREQLAHRMMWIAVNGAIPDGLCVCHHCDNPPCCNPKHLFLGTKRDNAHDAMRKGRFAFQKKAAKSRRRHARMPTA